MSPVLIGVIVAMLVTGNILRMFRAARKCNLPFGQRLRILVIVQVVVVIGVVLSSGMFGPKEAEKTSEKPESSSR